ncbi:MAG TPA: permease-like cell division protein FtsX [Myxococcales bacterium]|nr:permease-like cell division protein FtsX [Myxococcales bacterium]
MTHVAWRLLRRALINLWRAPLPSLLAVVTIALALFLGGAMAFSVLGARVLLASWGAQRTVTAYLDRALSEEQARAVAERLRADHPGVEVVLVSPAQALDRLRVQLGDLGGALDGLSRNPLPATLELTPRGGGDLRALADRVSNVGGVAEVDYGREWVDRLEALGGALRGFGTASLALLAVAALLVVANTIRLAVYARRDEIEIMKLVGATDGYVRAPFLLEGALQGLCGAALAAAGLLAVQRLVLPRAAAAFAFASGASAPHLAAQHCAVLAAAGALVGLCGSYLAVGRSLRT